MGKAQGGHRVKPKKKGAVQSKKDKHEKKLAVNNGNVPKPRAEQVIVDEVETPEEAMKRAAGFGIARAKEIAEEELGNNAEPIRKISEDDSRFDPAKLM